jgi:hypothetical protein
MSGNQREVPRRHVRRRRFRGHVEIAVWPGILICLAYTFYGLDMLLQPTRFSATPSYGTLTQILDIRIWGGMYLAVAVLFALYAALVISRGLAIIVHMVGIIITLSWEMAFVIRWLTDPSTTAVNPVSWGVLLLLIGRSASLIPVASRPVAFPEVRRANAD